MVESGWLVEDRSREISREELEECVKKRYRHTMFEHWEVFVHAMLEMLKDGMLPEEMMEEFQEDNEMGVEIKDPKTVYHYISDILDMYHEIKEAFYEALRKRIENQELPKNKTTFWKGRFLEDLVYEGLEEILEEQAEIVEKEAIVLPIYKIRTRPGTDENSKRGRKSDADKIADILVIDWSSRTLIVIELKNFWEHYSGKYDVEGQARKLPATVSGEGLDIILSKVKSGRIPGKKRRKLSKNLVKVGWEILCEKREEIQYQMHIEALKHPFGFRKVYVWFHAGELVDMLESKLDEFEKKYDIEILRVFVDKPLYYTPENKLFVKRIIWWMLYAVYNREGGRIRAIEIDSEEVLILYRDHDTSKFRPFEIWDSAGRQKMIWKV